MTPVNAAAAAAIAAMISVIAAAASVYLMRVRSTSAEPLEMQELEQTVNHLVRRLEVAAGRCIHDLTAREHELRKLLSGEETVALPASSAAGETRVSPEGTADRGLMPQPPRCLDTDLVSRAARACELAERAADEATICRLTGLQRAELRLLLSMRVAQQKAA